MRCVMTRGVVVVVGLALDRPHRVVGARVVVTATVVVPLAVVPIAVVTLPDTGERCIKSMITTL